MTRFETVLRRGLEAFGEENAAAVSPPRLSSIKGRARLEPGRGRRPTKGAAVSPSSPRPDEFGELGYPDRVSDNSIRHSGAHVHAVASGQMPAAAIEVVFDFADGTSLTVAPQRERYFITTFPGIADGTRIVAARAVDSGGQVIVSDRLPD